MVSYYMQNHIYVTRRYSREQVNNDVLSFAQLEASLNEGSVSFIEFDLETEEWVIIFREPLAE